MSEPLIKKVEVNCDQKTAFKIFIEEMSSWWLLDRFTTTAFTGKSALEIKTEPRLNGKIIEVAPDGTEYEWGTITNYEPFYFLSMSFHIPHPGEVVQERSILELRFNVVNKDKTKVELKQYNWEAFGKRAKMLLGGYGAGWDLLFIIGYANKCNETFEHSDY